VAGVGVGEVSGAQVEHAAEGGDEHAGVVVFGELVVDHDEGARGISDGLDGGLQERLADCHEERGGYALAGDIADGDVEVVGVEEGEVVEVAADFACGLEAGEEVEVLALGEWGEELGDDTELDLVGDRELAGDFLLGGGGGGEAGDVVAQLGAHRGEAFGEAADLVAAADGRERGVELAGGELIGGDGEAAQGRGE